MLLDWFCNTGWPYHSDINVWCYWHLMLMCLVCWCDDVKVASLQNRYCSTCTLIECWFFLLTYSCSFTTGAWIRTWVPSMHPITLGNPAFWKKRALWWSASACDGSLIQFGIVMMIALVTSNKKNLHIQIQGRSYIFMVVHSILGGLRGGGQGGTYHGSRLVSVLLPSCNIL